MLHHLVVDRGERQGISKSGNRSKVREAEAGRESEVEEVQEEFSKAGGVRHLESHLRHAKDFSLHCKSSGNPLEAFRQERA